LNRLRGSLTFDTSTIIEYLMGIDLGHIVKEYFETLMIDEKVYCSIYAISEVFYVLCRLIGLEYALDKIGVILRSGIIEVNNTLEMALNAGRLKCERAISIGDCSSIATAMICGSQVVFARREREIVDEMDKKPFDINVLFLSDLLKISRAFLHSLPSILDKPLNPNSSGSLDRLVEADYRTIIPKGFKGL